jgi:hypothetical protein
VQAICLCKTGIPTALNAAGQGSVVVPRHASARAAPEGKADHCDPGESSPSIRSDNSNRSNDFDASALTSNTSHTHDQRADMPVLGIQREPRPRSTSEMCRIFPEASTPETSSAVLDEYSRSGSCAMNPLRPFGVDSMADSAQRSQALPRPQPRRPCFAGPVSRQHKAWEAPFQRRTASLFRDICAEAHAGK